MALEEFLGDLVADFDQGAVDGVAHGLPVGGHGAEAIIVADVGGALADLGDALAEGGVVDHFAGIAEAVGPINKACAGDHAGGGADVAQFHGGAANIARCASVGGGLEIDDLGIAGLGGGIEVAGLGGRIEVAGLRGGVEIAGLGGGILAARAIQVLEIAAREIATGGVAILGERAAPESAWLSAGLTAALAVIRECATALAGLAATLAGDLAAG